MKISNLLPESPATLKELHVSYNHSKELPPELGKLTSLQVLKASYNIAFLPEEFSRLTNLKNLDIGNYVFKELPPELGQLTNLRVLDVSYNYSKRKKSLQN